GPTAGEYNLQDTHKIPGGSVFALAATSDGGRLRVAVAQGEGRRAFNKDPEPGDVAIWDSATQKVVRFDPGHKKPITALAFSPDATRLVTGSADQTARLGDLTASKR